MGKGFLTNTKFICEFIITTHADKSFHLHNIISVMSLETNDANLWTALSYLTDQGDKKPQTLLCLSMQALKYVLTSKRSQKQHIYL